jgi:hypothetical protein
MSYLGHVKRGVVIFDGPIRPPEGAVVQVVEVAPVNGKKIGEGLDRLAGTAKGLPADLAAKHNKYRRERRRT